MIAEKGQASMILIILVILIIMGLGIFLLGLPKNISQSEYLNLYSHNTLLSILRSDTGYTKEECKLVSDAVVCRFFTPSITCSAGGPTCKELAEDSIENYMKVFNTISENFQYIFIVTATDGVTPLEETVGGTKQIIKIRIPDDSSLPENETLDCDAILRDDCVVKNRFFANERLQKNVRGNECLRRFPEYPACDADPTYLPTCGQIMSNYIDCENNLRDIFCPGTTFPTPCPLITGNYVLNVQLVLARNETGG